VIVPGREGADVLVANYHAPRETDLTQLVDTLGRFGVRHVRLQRDVFDAELFFRLLALAPFGDLARMPQFKAATEPTAQLLTYPVLMAHDVAGYDEVIVGEDQAVHIEYAKRLLRKYNTAFGEDVRSPKARVVVGRVRDLRRPTQKMSKSSPDGCLFLDDPPDVIRTKLKAATADEAGLANLHFLYREFVGEDVPTLNSELKTKLADALICRFS
jgi:hypothetical protein